MMKLRGSNKTNVRWIPAFAGMTKRAVVPAQAGTQFPLSWARFPVLLGALSLQGRVASGPHRRFHGSFSFFAP